MKRSLLIIATLFVASTSLMAQGRNNNNNNNNRPATTNNGDRANWDNNTRPNNNNNNNWETQNGVRACNGNCLCGGQSYSAYQREMNDADFRDALSEVGKQAFDKDRLRMTMFIAENNFLSTNQITQLAQRFSFEDTKVEVLKNAYKNCIDKGVYFKAINTLSFSNNKDKVWDYINSYRPSMR